MNFIDIRSDTVTWPTPSMREAMADALVGDDVYGDDPTVKELEQYAASISGKEAALFVPSGTFGNQLALFTHCPRGTEVILDDNCHIVQHEVAASSIISNVQLRTVDCPVGTFDSKEIQKRIRTTEDIHEPHTSLICLENAQSSGHILSIDTMTDVKRIADRFHLPIHLDGARLFNAAIALGVSPLEITTLTDSVMFCLSKGLCAPMGSILAGTHQFIEKARKNRKIMGGGLRQAGLVAAAGLVALKEMRLRLDEDHQNARFLEKELSKIPEIIVEPSDINMVFFHFKNDSIDTEAFTDFLKDENILINPADKNGKIRFVMHYWITRDKAEQIIVAVKKFMA